MAASPPRAAPRPSVQRLIAVCRLVRRSWPIKFEGQFKRRDEWGVNAQRAPARGIEKVMMYEDLGRTLGDGLPCEFRKRITMGAMEMPAARDHTGADQGSDIWRQSVLENKTPGATRPGGDEGVGEHVRTRSHRPGSRRWNCGLQTVRTERRKLVSSAGPASIGAGRLSQSSIQPFDLMSRRHPLCVARSFAD